MDTKNLILELKELSLKQKINAIIPDHTSYNKKLVEIIQKELFSQQIKMNKSLENSIIDVLVENKTEESGKFFGKSEYMTSVIFNANDDDVGKIVKVKINKSNQNTDY